MRRNKVLRTHFPRLIAIVGGSGAGKTRLADELQRRLGKEASRLSLDDFYKDRSQLSSRRRERVNFDHPRAIDWRAVEVALKNLSLNRQTWLSRYDFATHSRLADRKLMKPKSIILMDGLWLLLRPSMRRLFDYAIFLDRPAQTRLDRRLARDLKQRGRTTASVRRQFFETVAPMHKKFVVPQIPLANLIFRHDPQPVEIDQLAKTIAALTQPA